MSLLAAPERRATPREKSEQNDVEECVFGIGGVAAAATSLFTLQFGPFAGIAMTDEALRVADANGDGMLDRFEQEGVSVNERLVVRYDAKSGRNIVSVATSDAIEESKSESPALPTVEPSYFETEDGERQYVWERSQDSSWRSDPVLFGLLYTPSVLVVGLIASLNRLTKKVKTLRFLPKWSQLDRKVRADKAFVVNAIKEVLRQLKEQKVTDETIKDLKKFFDTYRDVDDEFDSTLASEVAGNLASLEVLRREIGDRDSEINAMRTNMSSLATQLQQKKEEVKELEEEVNTLTEEVESYENLRVN